MGLFRMTTELQSVIIVEKEFEIFSVIIVEKESEMFYLKYILTVI